MRKVFGYVVLMLFASIYLISSSSDLTRREVSFRMGLTSILRTDKYRYGDLFGMCYLPQFRILESPESSVLLDKCDSDLNIHLYAICDSYLWSFANTKSFYCGVDSLSYARINYREQLEMPLDGNKRNILLLEFSERNLRLILNDTSYIYKLFKRRNISKQIDGVRNSSFRSRASEFLFNKSINTNLELNIWDFSIFTPVRGLKAELNKRLFNVVDDNVVISPDNKYLFYKPTIDTTTITSSFQYVPDIEIASIVQRLNRICITAKALGFKEVYLSVIPNPVSILSPGYHGLQYNHLVTRVQNFPSLKMHIVDIYTIFKNTSLPVYQKADSHWSWTGVNLWLNRFNSMLSNDTLDN